MPGVLSGHIAVVAGAKPEDDEEYEAYYYREYDGTDSETDIEEI